VLLRLVSVKWEEEFPIDLSELTVHGVITVPARRIISLAPSITEMLFYLGLGDSVAGVTRQCDFPEYVGNISNIGSFIKPDTKRINGVSPDIIIGLSDLHKHLPEIIEPEKAGQILLNYHDVRGVLDAMEIIAGLAVDVEKTTELVASLRRRVSVIQKDSEKYRSVKTLFMMHDDPVYTPGRSSYQYDALRIAGAIQMPYNNAQYERITLEQVAEFNPEVVFACGRHRDEMPRKICPGCQAEDPICQRIVDDIGMKPQWRDTTASRKGRIVALPCDWLCRAGPRLVDGMERIAGILSDVR
jgi:iron complex transport system substrate-binding protein